MEIETATYLIIYNSVCLMVKLKCDTVKNSIV